MVKEYRFDDRAALFSTLAEACVGHLSEALVKHGAASFLVSGGSTPAPLYEALSLADLDWSNIHVALVDERWVDRADRASNEGLIERTLLVNRARHASFTGMKTKAASAVEGQTETEACYRTLPEPFTLCILGMGNDGHTASLFPHAEGLDEALAGESGQLTAAIRARQSEVTGANTERMTLSLNGLLRSERLVIVLTGEEKRAVFRAAMGEGTVEDMPVRAVLRQNQVPVDLYWAP